jgi:hypothetical protein
MSFVIIIKRSIHHEILLSRTWTPLNRVSAAIYDTTFFVRDTRMLNSIIYTLLHGAKA